MRSSMSRKGNCWDDAPAMTVSRRIHRPRYRL